MRSTLLTIFSLLVGILIGISLAPDPATAAQSLPAARLTTVRMAWVPTAVIEPTPEPPGPGVTAQAGRFGIEGAIRCVGCTPFDYMARITNYDPALGDLNCLDYKDGYCWSATASLIPWEVATGWSAACPEEWPIGSWVDIPDVGVFICLDHGGAIVCKDNICAVDILGPGGMIWNGSIKRVTVWVPVAHWQHKRGTR